MFTNLCWYRLESVLIIIGKIFLISMGIDMLFFGIKNLYRYWYVISFPKLVSVLVRLECSKSVRICIDKNRFQVNRSIPIFMGVQFHISENTCAERNLFQIGAVHKVTLMQPKNAA